MRVGYICPTHRKFILGESCPECITERKKNTLYITTYDWIKQGVWEHIDPRNPDLRFNSKDELLDYCEKMSNEERDLIPKAFMKPKSQGKGYEIKRR